MPEQERMLYDDEERQDYVDLWRRILLNVAQWPIERVGRWVDDELERFLDGRSMWMYHEPPTYWVTKAFIPEHRRLSGTADRLTNRIYLALETARLKGCRFEAGECDQLRAEIATILGEESVDEDAE